MVRLAMALLLASGEYLDAKDVVWLERPAVEDLDGLSFGLHPPNVTFFLDCEVGPGGRLRECRFEGPPQALRYFDFIRLGPKFRMAPTTGSGKPVLGRRVRVPMRVNG